VSADPWWPLIKEDSWEIVEIGAGMADFLVRPEPWKQFAACRGKDPDLFFPRQGQHSRKAKLICDICVVKTSCDEYAERTGSEGVWGGELRSSKIHGVQDARPVRIVQPQRTRANQAVQQPGFGTIAARIHLIADSGNEGNGHPSNEG
jgi:WhiB family redox-sensing transcriptional regulator